MYRKYGQIFAPSNICTSTILGGRISQRATDGGAHMDLAPRAGLEPATNGLTAQATLCFYRSNLKNFKGCFDSNSPCHSGSEPIPKFTYDSLPKLNPNLWLRTSRKPVPARNYGKSNYNPKPNRFRNRECSSRCVIGG